MVQEESNRASNDDLNSAVRPIIRDVCVAALLGLDVVDDSDIRERDRERALRQADEGEGRPRTLSKSALTSALTSALSTSAPGFSCHRVNDIGSDGVKATYSTLHLFSA